MYTSNAALVNGATRASCKQKEGEKRRKTSIAEEKGRSHPLFPLRRPSNLGRGRKIETQEPETRTRDGPSETNTRARQRGREKGKA